MSRYIVKSCLVANGNGGPAPYEILQMTVDAETQCEVFVKIAQTGTLEWAQRIALALEEQDA